MFPMIIRATSRGRTYEYVHLCESIWKNGRSLRRTVVSLGRKDILDAHLDRIYEICRGHKPASPDDPVPLSSFHLGPFLVLRRLWDELGLPQRLGALADRVLVLVLNRLTRPSSEHALADWLTAFFACDSQGRRFAPAFLSDAQRAAAKNPRVKVQAFQLQRWYRTLDALLPLKDELEQHLFDRFRHLFALQCDLVFYDLTSTYFEGLGPAQLARHGYSRDKRPANPQILVGVAMVDGLPVSHTVCAGNRKDSTTVQGVIRDLRARFGLGRFVFVGDRGMLRKKEQAKVRKRLERLRERVAGGEFLRRAAKEWKRRAGKAGREKAGKAVHQAAGRESEQREREAEQRKLAASLIGESAGRILGANHGHRYYEWRLDEAGQLEYGESANCEQERRREGHWLLETECRVEERRVGLSQEAVAVLGLFLRLSPSVGASLTFLLSYVSSPRSSNRTCRFPASGSRTRSCLRPREAGRLPLQAHEAEVIPQPLARVVHVSPRLHLVLPTQPLAQPLDRVCVHGAIRRAYLSQLEVVRPAEQSSVQPLHHLFRCQQPVARLG